MSHRLVPSPKAVSAIALAFLVHCSNQQKIDPEQPPTPPPAVPVIAVGDGKLVGGQLGPSGGRLSLAANGPSVVFPAGTSGPEGLSVSLKQEPDAVLTSAIAIGTPFRSTRSVDAPSGGRITVVSVAGALPGGCDAAGVKFATQQPANAGPSDGAGSPALEWQSQPAEWRGDHAEVQLAKLWPMPMVFSCARAQ